VLTALYPIHARFASNATTPHRTPPIAVFGAVRPAVPSSAATPRRTTIWRGRVGLTAHAPRTAGERNGRKSRCLTALMARKPRAGPRWSARTLISGATSPLFQHPPALGDGHGSSVLLPAEVARRDADPPQIPTPQSVSAAGRACSDGVRLCASAGRGTNERSCSAASVTPPVAARRGGPLAYAGHTVTLRLWNGPGPKNDTTCDNGLWGDPVLRIGAQPPR
jgi:hypothetical protein